MSIYKFDFTANDTGDILIFTSDSSPASITVDNVSLKEITTAARTATFSVKEFLTGATDEGDPIFFRADSQQIQLNENFEMFSTPSAIVNRTKRGSLMSCFVALDDNDFYEIQGTVNKGVSTLKIHSKSRKNITTPPIAREIRLSWRDSSKQLCRLLQTSIVFTVGTMDYTE